MSTIVEFGEFFKLYSNLFREPLQEAKSRDWYEILKGLKVTGLIAAIKALSLEEDFPPSIKKIVDKYDVLKRQREREKRELEIQNQKMLTDSLTSGQNKCRICFNTGLFIYEKQGYEYHCRCSCARGRDLKRWSKAQITKEPWRNPKTGKFENVYLSDINDIFTPEEIEIIKIKNSEPIQYKNFFNSGQLSI